MYETKSPIPRRASAAAPLTRDVRVTTERDTDEWYPRMPRSAVNLQKARGVWTDSATRVQEDPVEPVRSGMSVRRFFLIVLFVILLGILIATLINTIVVPAAESWHNNAVYGFPRITRATASVGHGDTLHPLSQFIGINNDGVIDVVELSYGNQDQSKSQVYYIVTLGGPDAASEPITSIAFADLTGNGKLDMEVTVGSTVYILYNTGKTFTTKLP